MNIVDIVEPMKQREGVFVDCNFRQGREVLLKQLKEQRNYNAEDIIDELIEDAKNIIATLIQDATPYEVPEDYIFFLEFYGGLSIEKNSEYYFSTLGIGLMVEDYYPSINSDDAFHESGQYGFLKLGKLSFRGGKYKFQYIDFFLDLAGVIQKQCVIGIGPWGQESVDAFTVVKDIHTYPEMWQITADSFTEWLKQAAETHGSFGYM